MSNTALRAEFQALQASISHQKLVLDEMQTRLQSLQTRLDSITYPVLTLPPEITCEIFLLCLPEERETDVVNPKEAPLLLTHICRAWRQIAISLPSLWTTFEVVEVIDVPDLSNITQTWFERSRKHQISVKIHGCLASVQNLASLVETLFQHSHRLRSLELQVDLEHLYEMDSTHLLDLPVLRKLSLRLIDNSADLRLTDKSIEMFASVPLLTEVVAELPPSMLRLPWQQFTKFTGHRYTTGQCLAALRCMANVLECAFSILILDEEEDDDDDLESVSHLNIQHLSLFDSKGDVGGPTGNLRLLEFVTLPSLQTLQICGEDFDEVELDSLLERSQPPLQKLVVHPLDRSGGTELQLSPPHRLWPHRVGDPAPYVFLHLALLRLFRLRLHSSASVAESLAVGLPRGTRRGGRL